MISPKNGISRFFYKMHALQHNLAGAQPYYVHSISELSREPFLNYCMSINATMFRAHIRYVRTYNNCALVVPGSWSTNLICPDISGLCSNNVCSESMKFGIMLKQYYYVIETI